MPKNPYTNSIFNILQLNQIYNFLNDNNDISEIFYYFRKAQFNINKFTETYHIFLTNTVIKNYINTISNTDFIQLFYDCLDYMDLYTYYINKVHPKYQLSLITILVLKNDLQKILKDYIFITNYIYKKYTVNLYKIRLKNKLIELIDLCSNNIKKPKIISSKCIVNKNNINNIFVFNEPITINTNSNKLNHLLSIYNNYFKKNNSKSLTSLFNIYNNVDYNIRPILY